MKNKESTEDEIVDFFKDQSGEKYSSLKKQIELHEREIAGLLNQKAIGDVLSTQALAHVASAEGITCVEKIAGHNPEPIDYGNIPGCTYTSPEIASVGMSLRPSWQRVD